MQRKEIRYRIPVVACLLSLFLVVANAQQLLTLEDCSRLALDNNARMKNARLDLEGSKESRKEAFTKYFPSVSATGGAFASDNGIAEMVLMPGLEMTVGKNGVMGGVTAIQPVFAGGQI